MEVRVGFSNRVIPHVINMGLFVVDKPWLHYDRNIEVDTLLYVIEGCVNVCEEGIDYCVKEGEVFFLKINLRHWGKKLTPAGSKWYWICFNPFPIEDKENMLFIPKKAAVSNPNQMKHKLASMLEMFNSQNPFKSQVVNSHLYQIFINILRQQSLGHVKPHNNIIVDDIVKLLYENLESRFSAEIIMKEMNMNYSYLCRIFKKESGTTINRYFNELKIQKAIELLKSTDLNVSQISDKLNFPNPYYFSRIFKKVTGFPPSELKNHMYR